MFGLREIKGMKEKGITLVALVITIVILLILAGISISALTNTGIFGKVKEAKNASENVDKEQSQILSGYERELNKYSVGITADTIASATDAEKATKYYGKSVNYMSSNGVTGWKIFYVGKISDTTDAQNNIYLIADDYVDVSKLAKSTNEEGQLVENVPVNTNSSYLKAASFDNVIENYSTGAVRIRSKYPISIQQLNKSWFIDNPTYSSGDSNNMKAVAYMLDTVAWNIFKDKEGNASYAIGGPTLEILFKSYNQKHSENNYEAQALSEAGYQIRNNGGAWKKGTDLDSECLDTNDRLYVLPSSSGARAMWLASPSAHGPSKIMNVDYKGYVTYDTYNSSNRGFRPLICLNSDVQLLEKTEDEFIIK